MSIIASAPVPAGNRLSDADTIDLAAIRNVGRFPVNAPYRPAGEHAATCPAWCPGDCAPEVLAEPGTDPDALDPGEYFDRCRMHERFIANVPGVHAEIHSRRTHNAVEMERFDGPDGKVVEPTSISLMIAPDKPQPGDEMAKSRLTPEQAEQLGLALIEAARLARTAR